MEVAINTKFGGFGISEKAVFMLREIKNDDEIFEYSFNADRKRTDKDLISVIKKLGKEADGYCAEIKIVEIPDDVEWYIDEYDGKEWVAEKHRRWA